jgi:hypothetical protein
MNRCQRMANRRAYAALTFFLIVWRALSPADRDAFRRMKA